jgi:hypothetical protein
MTSLYDLTPGTRVVVVSGSLSGIKGVVIEMPLLDGHDCAVLPDPCDEGDEGDAWPLCFDASELEIVTSTQCADMTDTHFSGCDCGGES